MTTAPMRSYFMGQESLLVQCVDAYLERGHEVCGIIASAEPIVAWATDRGLPVIAPGKDLASRLSAPFDYFFSITNFSIIRDDVLALAKHGGINFHDGPLPDYAGMYVTAWALKNRESTHGVSWHRMTQEIDGGEILKQSVFSVDAAETSFTLNTKCYEHAMNTFGELVDELATGTASAQRITSPQKRYFGLHDRPEAAATLCWSRSAPELEALVRALDFGPIENPIALPKLRLGETVVVASGAEARAGSGAAAGTIVELSSDALVVATADGDLLLKSLRSADGDRLDVAAAAAAARLGVGSVLPELTAETATLLTEVNAALCRHEKRWVARLSTTTAPSLPHHGGSGRGGASTARYDLDLPAAARGMTSDELLYAHASFIARISDSTTFDLGYRDRALAEAVQGAEDYFARHVPLRVAISLDAGFDEAARTLAVELDQLHRWGSYAVDAIARHPALAPPRWRIALEQGDADGVSVAANNELTMVVGADGACTWLYDPRALDADTIASMAHQFTTFAAAIAGDRARPLAEQPILSESERQRLLVDWNATALDYPRDACVHQLFEAQVARTPDAPAVVHLDQELTYRELNERANQVAHRLLELGVGPDTLVGVCVQRSNDLVVATLGVMKAGGAYVPIDPDYPTERLALMLGDSKAPVVIVSSATVQRLPGHEATVLDLDAEAPTLARQPTTDPTTTVASDNLAYTIYTSGSTGRPKGVMVEHRNVVNFFAGMDERLGHTPDSPPGVLLALTSLSFDISVLELFWTLTRGFKVVLHSDKSDGQQANAQQLKHTHKPITFSLMYFASDEGENATSEDKYRLLLEGAKFGDRHGFVAVWTPERHFHAFGGLYPNPSVASAALATITDKIQLRAASVVLPLHHPIRVAEEWALVDNLSHGRVGIAFASGWQPNDFIIRNPERFEQRKEVMFEDLDTVRRLWRGETLKVTSPLGKEIEVRTLPRPIQKELPFWITAAGNPETFRHAGEIGANLLTHLLGQSPEEVAEKIAVYREARKKAGHEGRGLVTLMLHTFVGLDEAEVKATVREPMREYLRSSVNLIKAAAWTFPTFKKKADATGKTPAQVFEEEELSPEDTEVLLDHSFERYYKTSGLFGTPEACLSIVDMLKGLDVDDIGCLLDYGVPSAKVLAHLEYLNRVKDLATAQTAAGVATTVSYSMADQIERHGVTHMQCTPSQMTMLLADEASRGALAGLSTILIGGEAFPAALAAPLRAASSATIVNMYGPTETTIWSSTQTIRGDEDSIPIGRPIANTALYVLDSHRQPVPVGVAGELYIGGDGVVRGYYERPELTAERFVPDPWSATEGARMYRTGDVVRYRDDGVVEFLGRADFQIKLRGHRIELGEIETHIAAHETVREAVVVARETTPGDMRLVAYMVASGSATISVDHIQANLRRELPEHMVPSHFVVLPRFPLTPNKKVDRKALPSPAQAERTSTADYVAPTGKLEEIIADLWVELLNVKQVGMEDNFFDLGGHSLLTVQAHRRLKDVIDKPLSLTDLFRFPTIRTLVTFLESDPGDDQSMEKSKDRAQARKAALARRSRGRRPTSPRK